jgi:hypothetical protein
MNPGCVCAVIRGSEKMRATQPPLQFFVFGEIDSQIAQLAGVDFRW